MPLRKSSSFIRLLDAVKDSSRSTFIRSSKQQPAGSTTELSLEEFHLFLSQTLCKQCEGCMKVQQCLEMDVFETTLQEMEVRLLSILMASPRLPSSVVGEIHSYLGLIYLEQENFNASVDAFMRAIWFKSRTPEDTFAIAQANHRLGVAYGRKKEYKQAVVLLDKAIAAYDTSSDEYMMAKEDRHEFQESEQLELLAKTRPQSIHRSIQLSASNENLNRRQRRSWRMIPHPTPQPCEPSSPMSLSELEEPHLVRHETL